MKLTRVAIYTIMVTTIGTLGVLAWSLTIEAIAFGLREGRPGFTDFGSFWGSCQELLAGKPLYEGGNLNHPAMIVVMLPLLALPMGYAYLLWIGVNFLGYLLAAGIALRHTSIWRSRSGRTLALLLIATCPGAMTNAIQGQTAALIALLLVVAWDCLKGQRVVAAGALIGVAVVLKPFLVPLLAALIFRREWRSLIAATAAGAAISLAALPFVGLQGYFDWFHIVARAGAYEAELMTAIPGMLARLLDPAPDGLLASTSAAILLGGVALVAVRAPRQTLADDLAILLLAVMLANPRGWHYYLILLLPVAVSLVTRWPRLSSSGRMLAVAAVILVWVPPAFTSNAYDFSPPATAAIIAIALALLPLLDQGAASDKDQRLSPALPVAANTTAG